jgi:hypothetical protein
MTIQEIRDEIVEETAGDSSDADLLTRIFNVIRAAIRRLPKHVLSRTLSTIESVSLAAGDNNAALPTGFIKETYIYRKGPDGNKIKIDKASPDVFNSINDTTSGDIFKYRIIGKTIYFDRKTIETDTVYIECFKSQVGSLALSSTFFGNDDEVETIKSLAKMIYYRDYEEDKEKSDDHKGDAAAGLAAMKSDYMIRELPSHVEEA